MRFLSFAWWRLKLPVLVISIIFMLSACGGGGGSNIEVTTTNASPTANAGSDQSVDELATVTLDGSGSKDTDGSITSYEWKQTAGTTVALSDTKTVKPTFKAPDVAADETLTFELTVTDDKGATANDSVSLVIKSGFSVSLSGSTLPLDLEGSTVTIYNLADAVIDTTTTKQGRYQLNVPESQLVNGFKIAVTGGLIGADSFTDTLTATYKSTESRSDLNITAITTLVDSLAVDMEGKTEIESRDLAIQRLASIGILNAIEWNKNQSNYFDLNVINQKFVNSKGLKNYIDSLKEDLLDDELSLQNTLSAFNKAHGGIESISMINNFAVFQGNKLSTSIFAQPANFANTLTVNLLDAPSWVSKEGNIITASPTPDIAPDSYTVTLEVTNDTNLKGRKAELTISVMQQTVLLQGSLGINGGRLENEWKDIAIDAPAGVLKQDYNISYIAGLDSSKQLVLKLSISPNISQEERQALSLHVPDTDLIVENYLNNSSNNSMPLSAQSFIVASSTQGTIPTSGTCSEPWKGGNDEGKGQTHYINYLYQWYQRKANFYYVTLSNIYLNGGFPRVFEEANLAILENFGVKCSSRLVGLYPSDSEDVIGKEAVIFVHGFNSTEMAGYDNYFRNFPKLTHDLTIGNRKFIPFNFQWRTNARFEDVANELGQAIKQVNAKTGKQVHIVAHSFGGLLVRTLLQGLAEHYDSTQAKVVRNTEFNKSFMEKRIASVVTIGTPHSGIFDPGLVFEDKDISVAFDGKTAINFHDGRDSEYNGKAIELCQSISCHESGEAWASISDDDNQTERFIYGIEQQAGQIVYRLAESTSYSYPAIPTYVLIGILPDSIVCALWSSENGTCRVFMETKVEVGDGLITMAGQRFLPWLHRDGPDSGRRKPYKNSYVEEHLLGFDAELDQLATVGFHDNYWELIHEAMDKSSNFDDAQFEYKVIPQNQRNLYRIVSYHHQQDEYEFDYKGLDGNEDGWSSQNYWWRVFSQSGIRTTECDTIQNCRHASWFYFNKMVEANEAEPVDDLITIKCKGTVSLLDAYSSRNGLYQTQATDDLSNYRINIYLDGEKVGNTVTNTDGSFELDVEFKPNRTYVLEVFPPENMSTVYSPRAAVVKKTSAATIEETDLNFSRIELVGRTFQQGDLGITVKDGSTGAVLQDYTLNVANSVYTLVENKSILLANEGIVTLPHGRYTVTVNKVGYIGTATADCMVRQLASNSCVLTLLPEGYIVTGGLNAVLTWDANPSDLDSHLLKYDLTGNNLCHTFYGNFGACGVEGTLDLDDTSSYGPETVSMQQIDPTANYVYAIHHYSGSGSISSTSQAKVTVTFSNGLTRTFLAPTSGEGIYWKVFEIRGGKLIPCQSACLVNQINAPTTMSIQATSAFPTLPWAQDIKSSVIMSPKSY